MPAQALRLVKTQLLSGAVSLGLVINRGGKRKETPKAIPGLAYGVVAGDEGAGKGQRNHPLGDRGKCGGGRGALQQGMWGT